MADFVALYRGRTVSEAELVAGSAEPRLVERLFAELLGGSRPDSGAKDSEPRTSVLEVVRDD